MDIGDYLSMFLDESRENIDLINRELLALEQDPKNIEAVKELFRAAHTLKGMSATMGFGRLAELTHELESALDPVRSGERTLREDDVDVLLRATDRMEQMLKAIEEGRGDEGEIGDLIEALGRLGDDEEAAVGRSPAAATRHGGNDDDDDDYDYDGYQREIIRQALAQGLNVYRVRVTLRHGTLMAGARAFMVYQALESFGEILHSAPPVDDLEQERFDRSFVLTVSTRAAEADVVAAVQNITDVEAVSVAALTRTAQKGAAASASGVPALLIDRFSDYEAHHRHVFAEARRLGKRILRLTVTLGPGVLLKGARAYMVYQALEGFGEVLHSAPPMDDLEEGRFERVFALTVSTGGAPEAILDAVRNISEIQAVDLVEIVPDREAAPEAASMAREEVAATAEARANASSANNPAQNVRRAVHKMIRVDADRLEKLMNLFSELVIDRGRLEVIAQGLGHQGLLEIVEHMSRISGELQNLVLSIRMVSVESVFNRFPRMVRDVARELGKSVHLVVRGEETELDRTVVDEIGDPIMHLVRNAVDHGLESEAERKAKGKPPVGTVELVAYPSGNNVYIEVRDDGRGIDRDKVLKKAIERGLVRPEEAREMRDGAVYQLLFHPGFSTADVVTDISGRGVGLDVVKNKIESLGGRVAVFSKPGEGTIFRIQLPLTLSILFAMLVDIGGETYALPIADLLETIAVPPESVRTVHLQPVIDLRGTIIPLVDGRSFFRTTAPPRLGTHGVHPKVTDGKEAGEPTALYVAVIKKNERHVGLVVDRFIGQQEIVLKSLGAYLKRITTFLGATILGDGRVALVVEPSAFFEGASKGTLVV
ncbi:MAG: chemotaxis protein CheW [Hydrogenibacillus sp.]|nr:chemotaxis protein CheW [Hydrogenibacillus sp.]